MDVTGVGSRIDLARLPSTQDMAAVLAARPSMAQMSSKAAAEMSTQQDQKTDAIRSASAVGAAGQVDMYL